MRRRLRYEPRRLDPDRGRTERRSSRPEPDQLLAEVLSIGRLIFGSSGSIIERTEQLVVVIGTPVDEYLSRR